MIITLTSDFGTRDAAIAVCKAALMHHVPDAQVVDVSHAIAREDVQQAAYLLLSAYKSFAKGTVHIIAVDVFAGASPRILMAKKDGHFFIAPDNGIFPLAFGGGLENIRLCFECGKPYSFSDWMDNAGSVAAAIGQGWVLPYRQCEAENVPKPRRHQVTPLGVECSILHIDRYKNVVLDISKKEFDKIAGSKSFSIRLMKPPDITGISTQYNDVPESAALCRFNSAGFMEIAVNHGDAATLMGLNTLAAGTLKYRSVRIFIG